MGSMATSGPRFPPEVPAGAAHEGGRYRLQDGYYAVHGGGPASGAVALLEGGRIAVFRGEPVATDPETLGPVYAAPDGPLVVPTGRVFVRFREGVAAAQRRDELDRAGYELLDVPRYAPHTAWVRARAGGIGASLRGIGELQRLPDVDNVEPQMLLERAKR
jgi:hypothetical protein